MPFVFYDAAATTDIYTLSLHDALPIFAPHGGVGYRQAARSKQSVVSKMKAGTKRRRSEEHTSELQSHSDLVCRLLLEKKKKIEVRRRTAHVAEPISDEAGRSVNESSRP